MLRYLSIGALMLSSATAMAEGPSYSYIQANYEKVDIDGGDGDGFRVAGSVEINDSWFVFAGYGSSDIDEGLIRFDLDRTTLGGGWNSAISERTDWFVTLAYVDVGLGGTGFPSRSDNGIGANVGIRSMLNPNFEFYGSLGYADFSERGDVTVVAAGLWYTVGGNVALGFDIEADSDITSYGIGIRLYFDK
jgi:hypothetical protein